MKNEKTDAPGSLERMVRHPNSKWTLKIEVREDGLKTTTVQKVLPRRLPPQITTEQMTPSQTDEVLSGLELVRSLE